MNNKKSTRELEEILGRTHIGEWDRFVTDNNEAMLEGDRHFADYMRGLIKEKGIKQQEVFLFADIPERYGYKLLSEEKRTKKRDVIIRLCYGARFTLSETQRALKIYGMSALYARNERDAVLMIAFNERPGNGEISAVNELLETYGYEILEASGMLE